MVRRKTFDQAVVIRAARDVFWARGYEATSLNQLQEAMSLSRSSLYETFGSKRQLFALAIDSYLAEVISPRLAPLEQDDATLAALVTYFRVFARFLREAPPSLARRGCLLVNTATELDLLDDEASVVVEAYRERVRSLFLSVIRRAAAAHEIADLDHERHAELLTAQVVGLFLTCRLNLTAAADLAETIAADVTSWAVPA